MHTLNPRRAAASFLTLALTAGILAAGVISAAPATAEVTSSTDASDEFVAISWLPTGIAIDDEPLGMPNSGDLAWAAILLSVVGGVDVALEAFVWDDGRIPIGFTVPAGTNNAHYFSFEITAGMIDELGGGPYLDNLELQYTVGGEAHTLVLPRIPLAYTAPEPFEITVTPTLDELSGNTTDGVLTEGDRVKFPVQAHNTGSSAITVIDGVGSASVNFPDTVVPAGGATTWTSAWHTVTYADMVQGYVAAEDVDLEWTLHGDPQISHLDGPRVPTEAPVTAIDTTWELTVRDASTQAEVNKGDIVAGDVIHFGLSFTNTGNVSVLGFSYYAYGTEAGLGTGPIVQFSSLETPPGSSEPGTGTTLPWMTSVGGLIPPVHTVTVADLARGYVDVSLETRASPRFGGPDDATSTTVTERETRRVFLRDLTPDVDWTVTATLNDVNGDGIGQSGETIDLDWNLANSADSDQDISVSGITEMIYPAVGTAFDAANLAVGDSASHSETVTIDDAMVASGAFDYEARVEYVGDEDDIERTALVRVPTVALGDYVAPATSLDASASVDDTNGDGLPSIGETATVTVVLANLGTYPLTGVVVEDVLGSDVTGLLPTMPDAVAGGQTAEVTFTYVLTVADFARGSLAYGAQVTADGMATTASSTQVLLEGITFAAYESDLLEDNEGGVSVCSAEGMSVDEVTLGDTISVVPGDCDYDGDATGSRVLMFSEPVQLSADSFVGVVPSDLTGGMHRLALYGPDGTIMGWTSVTVAAAAVAVVPVTDAVAVPVTEADVAPTLSMTGFDGGRLAGGAIAMLLAGLVLVGSRRRFGL